MADNITITEAEGTWVIRAGGAVIGESDAALKLEEDGYPFIIYFPRDDIAMAFLDESDKKTSCPHKGDANYYTIQTNSKSIRDAAWSYENPRQDVARIAGHLAFMHEDVTVEQV